MFSKEPQHPKYVAPLAGAWIEILERAMFNWSLKSLPSRERGLKFSIAIISYFCGKVAPLAGAWIEIPIFRIRSTTIRVAPLAGAWIEIVFTENM